MLRPQTLHPERNARQPPAETGKKCPNNEAGLSGQTLRSNGHEGAATAELPE